MEQIVRELFPSRRKRLLDEVRELMRLRHVGFPVQADQGRVHFGTGLERAWRHGEAITDRCVVLDQNGERPVVAGAGFCDQPFRNFLLNHYCRVDDAAAVFDESLEQWRCHVVGKVSDQVEPSIRKVHQQCIAFDNFDIGGHPGAQARNQVFVDFDGDHAMCSRCQLCGERSGSGTDFDNRVVGPDVCELNNPREDRTIRQKMLAEAFLQENRRPMDGLAP